MFVDCVTNTAPTAESLSNRARIAQLVSPLRRTRPRVPFFRLAAHRAPTLWSLYRGLLSAAPSEDIRFRVQAVFRRNKGQTGAHDTKEHLRMGYKFLDIFRRAQSGDEHLQAVLNRYTKLIHAKREKDKMERMIVDALLWEEKLRNRPILTGAYLRPHLSHGPLPRLKPQPMHISGMIYKRRRAREGRIAMGDVLREERDDIRHESHFENKLLERIEGKERPFERFYSGDNLQLWLDPIREQYKSIMHSFSLELQRRSSPYPPEMLDAIDAARREKPANKARELERERRGEVLKRTLLRQNAGPPAHVLSNMTPEQRKLDQAARSVSEVGYVAMAKGQLGHRLREPEKWKAELGKEDDWSRLEEEEVKIRQENERRRRLSDEDRVEDNGPPESSSSL